MPRLLGRMLCWIAVPFLALAAFTLAGELLGAFRIRAEDVGYRELLGHPAALACAGGFLFRGLFRSAFRRLGREDPLEFVDTLEHELTHALMGYLTLSPPVSLSASLRGDGEVQLKRSNPLAALAPYFFPLWCLLAAALGTVVRGASQPAWDVLVFALLGAFAHRLGREFRWRQTDLHAYGFAFSLCAVLALLPLMAGAVLSARGLLAWDWMEQAPPKAWALLENAWEAWETATGRLRTPG